MKRLGACLDEYGVGSAAAPRLDNPSMLAIFFIFAVLVLPEIAHTKSAERSDALSSLEQSSSPAATAELSRLLRKLPNPYARFWIVNALYERVRRHQDVPAMALLTQAAADPNADVRRHAVGSLEAFKFLPQETVRKTWLPKVQAVAAQAEKDRIPYVRAAGTQLLRSAREWEKEHASQTDEAAGSERNPGPGSREGWGEFWSRLSGMQTVGLFVWIVSFHFLALLWQDLGVRLLKDSGPAGAAVLAEWKKFRDAPRFLIFPGVSCLFLLLVLGGAAAYGLLSSVAPAEGPMETADMLGAAGSGILICAASAVLAFFPAAVLAGFAVKPQWKAVFSRHHALVVLSLFVMAGVWPCELVLRAFHRRPSGAGVWRWAARTGAPLAGALAAAYMIREDLGWRQALRRAAERYEDISAPAAALFGNPLFQPQFALPALSAPAFCAFSLLPAIFAAGFSPARLFGWWFVSDGACVAGFAIWGGLMMSAAYLALLWSLGALYAARKVLGGSHD